MTNEPISLAWTELKIDYVHSGECVNHSICKCPRWTPVRSVGVPEVLRCNSLHAQLPAQQNISHSYIWFEASGFSSHYLCMALRGWKVWFFMSYIIISNIFPHFLTDRRSFTVIPCSMSRRQDQKYMQNIHKQSKASICCKNRDGCLHPLVCAHVKIQHFGPFTFSGDKFI